MNIQYHSPHTYTPTHSTTIHVHIYIHRVAQSTYIPASIVVIVGGFVTTETPGTPSLRAATNKEYVVPCCGFGSVTGDVVDKTVKLPVPLL